MAKDAYYFSHDSNSQDDPKCMMLIDQLGMEGYGIFWALIEKLRNETKPWLNRYITNNVLRDFKAHAKKAELKFNGKFTVHTFRKSCAQNWADRLPANVVKFYLGHSNVATTNKFYSIVDKEHLERTRQTMDEMLKTVSAQNDLDTGWTLEGKKQQKTKNTTQKSSVE
jgi:hypothetical protein